MAWLGGKSSEGAAAPLSLVRKQGVAEVGGIRLLRARRPPCRTGLIGSGSHGIISFSEGRLGKAS